MGLVFSEISKYKYYLNEGAYIVLSIQTNELNIKVKQLINIS
jgi:hypothetical protein